MADLIDTTIVALFVSTNNTEQFSLSLFLTLFSAIAVLFHTTITFPPVKSSDLIQPAIDQIKCKKICKIKVVQRSRRTENKSHMIVEPTEQRGRMSFKDFENEQK